MISLLKVILFVYTRKNHDQIIIKFSMVFRHNKGHRDVNCFMRYAIHDILATTRQSGRKEVRREKDSVSYIL
jgi:chorismate synthase